MNRKNDCPPLYTKYPPWRCFSGGRYPVITASRIIISASVSHPTDSYSAIPSANHSGIRNIYCRVNSDSSTPPYNISNCIACTSSWYSTCRSFLYDPSKGNTIRFLKYSVNPPVSSPINSRITFVSSKSLWEEYTITGIRELSSCRRSALNRSYTSSIIVPAIRASSSSPS